jgi:DNA-binding ferritin-like protein
VLTQLDTLHTKIGFYNLNIASAKLYPLSLALHALYEETATAMHRVATRLGGMPLQARAETQVASLGIPATWEGLVDDLVTEQERLMAMFHQLMPVCRRAGDITTLRLLAELADFYGESIMMGRAWLAESAKASADAEENPWNAACY